MDVKVKFKKLFNYRPLLSICLFFMAGTITVVGFYAGSVKNILISSLMLALLVTTIVLKAIYVQEKKKFKIFSVLVAFAFAVISSVCFIEVYNNKPKYSGTYYVEGVVASRTYKSGNNLIVTIEDVTAINIKTQQRTNIKGKVRFYLTEQDGRTFEFELGEEIKAQISLSNAKLFRDGEPNFTMFNRDIYVIGYGEEESLVSLNTFDRDIQDKFKLRVKESLDTYMSKDYSELAYTMLFGDKSGLNVEMSDNYSASGIGHLLAVSGLHVGFIVTLISFMLSLFKASKKVRFWVTSIIIFFYAMLCGFTVSITRAFIMTVVLLYSRVRAHQYDGLSSLSFAALIILLLNPMWIFDVGFQLSFGAVAGIIIFSPFIKEFFEKFFHEKFAGTIAISCGATIGTLPFMLLSFSKFSVFSIVANLIVIPIASIAYMLLFVFVILALIVPRLGMFTYLFEVLMKVVTGVSSLMGALNLAGVSKWLIGGFSVSLISTGIMASQYVFVEEKCRKYLTLSFSVLTIVLFVAMFI